MPGLHSHMIALAAPSAWTWAPLAAVGKFHQPSDILLDHCSDHRVRMQHSGHLYPSPSEMSSRNREIASWAQPPAHYAHVQLMAQTGLVTAGC